MLSELIVKFFHGVPSSWASQVEFTAGLGACFAGSKLASHLPSDLKGGVSYEFLKVQSPTHERGAQKPVSKAVLSCGASGIHALGLPALCGSMEGAPSRHGASV